jgi:cytochrome c oxidase assembly protein subunit 15
VATDRRRWLARAAFGALALVILQGILGGTRVLLDARLVAMLHWCVGPLFFAYTAGLVVVTSRWWQKALSIHSQTGLRFARAAAAVIGIAYVQLVLGALLRHMPLAAAPGLFRAALFLHLLIALALAAAVLTMALRLRSLPSGARGLRLAGVLLPSLVGLQLVLGVATYVAKYAFPSWLGNYTFAAAYVVQEKSLSQSLTTTAHVATGSLILFFAVVLAMRAMRRFRAGQAASWPLLESGGDKVAACLNEVRAAA